MKIKKEFPTSLFFLLQVNQSENTSTEETPNPTHCFALVQKKASSMLCLQMEQKDTRDPKGLKEPAARVAPVPQHHLLLVSDMHSPGQQPRCLLLLSRPHRSHRLQHPNLGHWGL